MNIVAGGRTAFTSVLTLCDRLAGIVMTPRCRGCGGPLLFHDNPFLCAVCSDRIGWIGPGACHGCGYPAGAHARHAENCFRCRDGRMGLSGAAGVARYAGGARELVRRLKFRGEQELAGPMARVMAARYRTAHYCGRVDVVIPVPLHTKRQRERGFNQSILLGRTVAGETGLPFDAKCLLRIRETIPQANLSRESRLLNLAGAFRSGGGVSGRRVLLVDDVMTTGATMAACSAALREAGATRVYGLVFAR